MVKKNRIPLYILVTSLATLLIIPACKDNGRHKPDLTGHEVSIKINRLEDDIMGVSTFEQFVDLDELDSLFIEQYKSQIMVDIIGITRVPMDVSAAEFVRFTSNEDMRHLFQSVQETFPSLDLIESDLSEAFSYHHYFFPDKPIPRVITFLSPFIYATATTDETLAIGLDMYLGESFEPYHSPNLQQKFPQYRINRCRRDFIPPNAMKAWLLKEFEIDNTDRRLINQMVYEGKILYAMDKLMPDLHDSLKIQYAKGKIEWCKENEYAIWNNLIENDLLYSTDYQSFAGLISEGPFSKGINVPAEAPPMLALWTGWQIVRKYMDKNAEVSLAELMAEIDSEKILKESAYKP